MYNESNWRRITKRMVIKKALENPTSMVPFIEWKVLHYKFYGRGEL